MAEKKAVSRRWLVIAWGTAAVIVTGYYALWRHGAGVMRSSVLEWVDDQRAAGMTVTHGSITRHGFPFFLRLHIDDPDLALPDVWRWQAERLTLDALPYDLNKLIFTTSGEQRFEATGINTWRYRADDLRASIANDKKRGWVFSMNIAQLSAYDAQDKSASIGSLIFDVAPSETDPQSLTLVLAGEAIAVPARDGDVALDKIETAITASQMSAGSPASWHAAGGTLTIHGLNLVANEAEFSTSGSLRLDREQYPAGVLDIRLTKPFGLADIFAASGVLSREESDAAAAGLGMAAMAQGGALEGPVTFERNGVFFDGNRVADAPALFPSHD